MRRPARRALLLVLLPWAAAARGQEPAPAAIGRDVLARGEAIELIRPWRFHAGDDPRWSAPGFDDSGWRTVEPLLPGADRRPLGAPEVGWFRRHLRVDPALAGKPLTLSIEAPGAAAVFLDGEAVLNSPGAPRGAGVAGAARGAWSVATLGDRPEHVLAVRYELAAPPPSPPGPAARGFRLSITEPTAAAGRLTAERRRAAVEAVFIGLPALLALLHLALYWSYPKARENLFYAASMVCFVGIVVSDLDIALGASETWRVVAERANTLFVLGACFFLLLTHRAVRARSLSRIWIGFALAGGALAVVALVVPSEAVQSWSWYLYFGAVMVATLRLEASGRTVRREGVPVLLGGFLILDAIILLQILIDVGLVPPVAGIESVYVFGILAFGIAMSLFLARTSAGTSLQLERHKGEIEAARAFQLSLVPRELPRVAGLETAAAMSTATEVGGDYYDFKTDGDGSLVVAVGDATGHGLAAGTMVTAVKAIFSVLGVGQCLPETLAECDRVLRGMNVRPLHMCLTLARITPRSVTVCSAAMPPVLLHRSGSGEVEELGAGGLPLGGRLSPTWQERRADLRPGDTLLFATDGLAEALDPAGAVLGYAGAARVLGEAADATAGQVVERLMTRAAAWRGAREQTDDLTLVAVRVL